MLTTRDKTATFSGYRDSKMPYTPDIDSTINSLYADGYREFITGGATGFDTMAALSVIRMRRTLPDIRLTLAIPFVGQEQRYTPYQKELYRQIAKSADRTVVISEIYHDSVFLERNRYMLSQASALVCFYDGQRGGTMHTVNRASKLKLKIINLCAEYTIDSDPQGCLF